MECFKIIIGKKLKKLSTLFNLDKKEKKWKLTLLKVDYRHSETSSLNSIVILGIIIV